MGNFDRLYVTSMKESINAKRPETDVEKIDYLMETLPLISLSSKNKNPDELAKMAIRLIGRGMFPTIYANWEAHKALKMDR